MSAGRFQCAINFSEGRRLEVAEAIVGAMNGFAGAEVADWSADPDHNRSVITLLGDAEGVRKAGFAGAEAAVSLIDMRVHTGIHPRTGAIDVLPFTPLENASRDEAVALAHSAGAEIAEKLALPVYFYEWAASPSHSSALPELRRGGWERFAHASLTGALAPDAGPALAHPTAGILICGARGPLVACNFLLDTTGSPYSPLSVAQALARSVRQERAHTPELAGVRALGLYLPSRALAQLSLNLTCPERTPLPALLQWVKQRAAPLGASVVETEVIGILPAASLAGQTPVALLWKNYRPAQILP